VTLDFGRHAGKALSDRTIPLGYLKWLLTGCDRLDPWQAEAVQRELARRGTRFLDAAAVIDEFEQAYLIRLLDDERIDRATAARMGDHLLEAGEELRRNLGIGAGTKLLIPPPGEPWRNVQYSVVTRGQADQALEGGDGHGDSLEGAGEERPRLAGDRGGAFAASDPASQEHDAAPAVGAAA
jgi:hypothetical protein